MDRLTISQRIKILKTYYKNDDSATATYCALREDYGLHHHSTTQAIGKIVKKLEETEMVTNIEGPVQHGFTRSAENIAIVSESFAENPNVTGIWTVLRHIMMHFVFRSTFTSIKSSSHNN